MQDRSRNRYDALKRVKKFKEDHAADFPATGTPGNVKATALFATIATAVTHVGDAIEGRASAEAAFHGGTTTETTKRNALMLDLAELNRAAAGIAEETEDPGLMDQFRMPWGASEAELPGLARAMIAKAASMSAKFLELDFPASFAADIEQHVVDFETAGGNQDAALGEQAGWRRARLSCSRCVKVSQPCPPVRGVRVSCSLGCGRSRGRFICGSGRACAIISRSCAAVVAATPPSQLLAWQFRGRVLRCADVPPRRLYPS